MDSANVERVRAFAAQLGAGVTIRIERRAPAWCSGWQEDTELETGSLGELLEYVRDTWGGHKFRVSVIHPATSQPMHTAPLTIGGPPRDQGRPIDRDSWDAAMGGVRPSASLQAVAQPAPPAAASSDLVLGLLKEFMSEQRTSRDQALQAVQEVAKAGAQRQTELLSTFGREFRNDREDRSLRAQLDKLKEGIDAVEDLKETVAATLPEVPDDRSSGIVDALKEEVGRKVVSKFFDDATTPATAPETTPTTNGASAPSSPAAAAAATIPDAQSVQKPS